MKRIDATMSNRPIILAVTIIITVGISTTQTIRAHPYPPPYTYIVANPEEIVMTSDINVFPPGISASALSAAAADYDATILNVSAGVRTSTCTWIYFTEAYVSKDFPMAWAMPYTVSTGGGYLPCFKPISASGSTPTGNCNTANRKVRLSFNRLNTNKPGLHSLIAKNPHEMAQRLYTHEAGHSLGLNHINKSALCVPVFLCNPTPPYFCVTTCKSVLGMVDCSIESVMVSILCENQPFSLKAHDIADINSLYQ